MLTRDATGRGTASRMWMLSGVMHAAFLRPARRASVMLAIGFACFTIAACGAAVSSSTSTTPARRGVTWLIFVDDLHLDFRNTGRLRDMLRTMKSELLHEGDIFAVRSSGPSSLSIGLTPDRTPLDPAIKATTGNGLKVADILRDAQEPIVSNEVRYRANVAVSAALEMITSLEPVRGRRTALLYISNGYALDSLPDRDVDAASPLERLSELTRVATRARIRIFAISPPGLPEASASDPPVDPAASERYRASTRRSLQTMAERTDGIAFIGEQDPTETMTRISHAVRE